jgi:hypothetical protein
VTIGFPATYSGRCGNCGEVFAPGTEVFYAQPDDVLTGMECCGEAEDPETVSEVTPASKVMPRGKTARDRCDVCFQIRSSNNTCGCD